MHNGDRTPVAGSGTAADGQDGALFEAFERLYSGALRDLGEALELLEQSKLCCAALATELERSRDRGVMRLARAAARTIAGVRGRVRRKP